MYSANFPETHGRLEVGARAGYRREFDEMENRIRKCERERTELERRFADLMRERAECERAAARAMKQRYKRMIEAERQRTERNESILRMLNKIDQQAASLAAKTDRLKMLKTQYEMYLMRTWPSAQPPGIAHYAPLMIAAPPPAPPSLSSRILQSPSANPKSEFVQYLSELTHQQTANVNPIPPPTALSNYLASQQQRAMPLTVPPYGAGLDHSLAPSLGATDSGDPLRYSLSPVPSAGSESKPLARTGTAAKRFEMSNEDFIRYIDSEVLKEPIPDVNVMSPSPEPPKHREAANGAYLEDVAVSEDEQRPVKELSDTMEQFAITMNKEDHPREAEDALEKQPELAPLQDHSDKQTALETTQYDVDLAEPYQQPTGEEITNRTVVDSTETIEQQLPYILEETPMNSNFDPNVKEEMREPDASYSTQQPEAQYHQPIDYGEDVSSPPFSDEQLAIDKTENYVPQPSAEAVQYVEPAELQSQPYNEPNYPVEQYQSTSYQGSVQSAQQTAPTANVAPRNPYWSTARQAMKSRAFPNVGLKPVSPEMIPEQTIVQNQDASPIGTIAETSAEYQYGTGSAEVYADQQPKAENVPDGSSGEGTEQNVTYQNYDPAGQSETNYTAGNVGEQPEQLQDAARQGYQSEDANQQPVTYAEAQYETARHPNETEDTAAYQYQQQPDGQQGAYQDGQYGDGSAADQTQYQYQGGEQEAYQNQQYQYDANAQYYDQQQGYEGQYYTEDQQQQQQQYYTEDGGGNQAPPPSQG